MDVLVCKGITADGGFTAKTASNFFFLKKQKVVDLPTQTHPHVKIQTKAKGHGLYLNR